MKLYHLCYQNILKIKAINFYYYHCLNKFQAYYQTIKSQKMQSQQLFTAKSHTQSQNNSIPEQQFVSLFQRYRSGHASTSSAFKLYSIGVNYDKDSEKSAEDSLKMRGSYRKYTFEQKQMAVAKIRNGQDVKQISKEYGIPRRNLLRWKKNGCERKEGGGRPTDCDMERVLYEKIQKKEINGEKEIRTAAISVSTSDNFKASKGWFSKFCRRYKLQTGEDLLKA